jgi:hydroxyethylthiazole kinase
MRLNAAEFAALAGKDEDGINDAALARFAKTKRTVVGLTGAQDFIRDGERLATIANGDPLMARVTAMGCVASALVGAALAVEPDAWKAMAAALIAVGVAGEVAAARSRGPGSFAMEILDAVYALDRGTVMAKARVS